MSNDDLPKPDVGLENAQNLVIRVLDFVASDQSRLARFLGATGMRLERLRETAETRSFMLSVIDAITADQQLLEALANLEQIRPEDIELARARLMFEAVAEDAHQGREDATDRAIREKVKQLLRSLAVLMRQRQDPSKRSA